MREVQGSNPLGGNILCSPSLLEETINRGPNIPIPKRHSTEGGSVIIGVENESVSYRTDNQHA